MAELGVEATQPTFGRESVIDRKTLKPFMARTNAAGLWNFFGHMSLIALGGVLIYFALGTWWVVPAIIAQGFVMAFLFAPVHECSHGTAFRSRGLNDTVYWIVCLLYIVPPTLFKYDHAAHHTNTQIRGRDKDMLPLRMTIWSYLYFVSGFVFWLRGVKWLVLIPCGYIPVAQRTSAPQSEYPRIIRESRVILGIYGLVAVVAISMGSWAPLTFWVVPRLVGEPFMRWLRIAEHGECAEGGDLRENTRTTRAPKWLHFLFWKMSYHAEHHLCPMVPFHALDKLHAVVGDKLHPVGEGYFQVHKDVLKKILRHEGVTWQAPQTAAK